MSQRPTVQTATPVAPSNEALLKATGLSLVVAVIVLVCVVLPAEYGIDPLGTGAALGLSNLSAASKSTVIAKEAAVGGPLIDRASAYKVDAIEFTLVPGDSFEYKYQLDRNATMLFHWKASNPIEFDLHTEPDQGGAAASDSFAAGTRAEGNGSYLAPYAGIHGWYWKNTDPNETVTITLQTAGFYTAARLFAGSPKPIEMKLQDPPLPPDL